MPHPLAHTDPGNGFDELKAGDRVIHAPTGRHGVADEFLTDGEAFVTFDDGAFDTVKSNHLHPELPENSV
jgi:hypothetical protein